MVVLDTNVILDRIKGKSNIQENVTAVSVIEFPLILKYVKFKGKVYYPKLEDFKKAYKIQEKLYQIGKMKNFADLLIAAICISKREKLACMHGKHRGECGRVEEDGEKRLLIRKKREG